jgi:hypothetical protein
MEHPLKRLHDELVKQGITLTSLVLLNPNAIVLETDFVVLHPSGKRVRLIGVPLAQQASATATVLAFSLALKQPRTVAQIAEAAFNWIAAGADNTERMTRAARVASYAFARASVGLPSPFPGLPDGES